MPAGFFSASTLQTARKPAYSVPRCGACGLLKSCKTPKMPVSGKGRRGILIVGEAPGKDEDEQGRPFIGKAGQKLAAVLDSIGVNLRRDCWITNALICRPPKNKIDDPKKIDYCRPNLTETIRRLKPHTIVTLGYHALRAVIAPTFPNIGEALDRWVGWQIPLRSPDAWICPTWHPAYLMRQNDPPLELWFRRHLKKAFALESPPWGGQPPDYSKGIEIYHDPDEAAKRILALMLLGDFPAAFDYETTHLKPDAKDARIVCASICWEGKTTIAFPFAGAAIDALRAFLRSPAPKRGWNNKFEDRWSRAKLGVSVKNWEWDGMLTAHVGDNRRGITGLKFQAFVRLGQPVYNDHIEPFLTAKGGGNSANRINEVDFRQLALYCGMDSRLEWAVSEIQRKEMGYGLD
jgi:DNA polymerase